MLSIFKNTVFVFWLLGALASLSIGSTVFALQAMATATRLSAQAATAAVSHRREITQAVAKVKAKARLKRIFTMIPIAGAAAGAYFEEQEYEEWLISNPDGSRQEYLCEVASVSSEVIDEILLELPKMIRPSKTTLSDMMPKCESDRDT
jgi:hypothetical protein